jgi:hypothetical protein
MQNSLNSIKLSFNLGVSLKDILVSILAYFAALIGCFVDNSDWRFGGLDSQSVFRQYCNVIGCLFQKYDWLMTLQKHRAP